MIGNYRDMSWHPAIASAEVTPGELKKEVTKRKLSFKSGAVFTDTLTRYDPATRTLAFLTNDEDLKTLPATDRAPSANSCADPTACTHSQGLSLCCELRCKLAAACGPFADCGAGPI